MAANDDHVADSSEVVNAFEGTRGDSAQALSRLRRTKLKLRQFFGEYPSDNPADHGQALGHPKSSLGVLNDKGTMAVPGMCLFPITLHLCCQSPDRFPFPPSSHVPLLPALPPVSGTD